MRAEFDAVVIGGGVFGCTLALQLRQQFRRVAVLEKQPDLLTRASYVNQARIHQGYHYPRSLLTGIRSRVNFSLFVDQFGDCIESDFDKYYAIGKHFSKVTPGQFKLFCGRIGAFLEPAPKNVKALFDFQWVDEVYRVREYAFDAVKLRERLRLELSAHDIHLRVNCEAHRVAAAESGLKVSISSPEMEGDIASTHVFNCTYSQINRILEASGLPVIPLKHEVAELALVEPPTTLRRLGVTIMDGPFFSFMPFPSLGLHTLSHVRYTPHHSWHEKPGEPCLDGSRFLGESYKSRYPHMVKDAARYIPELGNSRYVESMWEIKTVLPRSEVDDSRPILVRRDHGLKNFTCILGAKIDNIYDIFDELHPAGLRTRR